MGLNIEKPLVFIAILSVTLLVAASITVIIVFLLNDIGVKTINNFAPISIVP